MHTRETVIIVKNKQNNLQIYILMEIKVLESLVHVQSSFTIPATGYE